MLEKIERAWGNLIWAAKFEDCFVEVLPITASDHAPLLLHTELPPQKRRPNFKFEAMWLQHKDCNNVVHNAWNSTQGHVGSSAFRLVQKIKVTTRALNHWNRDNFGNMRAQITECERSLLEMQQSLSHNCTTGQRREEMIIRKRLEFLLNCEQIFWAQRAKQMWLINGDRNTRYFHTVVKHRRSMSKIFSLKDEEGNWTHGDNNLRNVAKDYFERLFTNQVSYNKEDNEMMFKDSNVPTLSNNQYDYLQEPFTMMEIETALFEIDGYKAPGPDGMPAIFYQHFWPSVKDDITQMVASFLNSGRMLKELNQSTIILIPKGDEQQSCKDYRPISLCNVSYKIISKVLTNRLQKLMQELISPFQKAFAKGRSITDNILIAHEVLRYIRRHKKGKTGWASIKIDLQKAYDKISWEFLQDLLNYMNFPPLWVQLIMQCVTTVSFRVQVNGGLSEQFLPKAGLRQGDPISPNLFILCVNVLSGLLIKCQDSKIKGIKVARGALTINHLIYADDILLFLKDDIASISEFWDIFKRFEASSGLSINPAKSEITFSPNCTNRLRKTLDKAYDFQKVDKFSKYLGSHIDEAPRSRRIFEIIMEKLHDRLQGWKSNLLSQAARVVLIKSVLSSLPLYHLSYFRLSQIEAHKCDMVLSNFFWGNSQGKNSPHMKS